MKSQKNSKQSKQPQPSALAHQSKGSQSKGSRRSSTQHASCPAHPDSHSPSHSHSHSRSRRRHRGYNSHRQEGGVAGNNAGGLSDTIISTAVHSAIRLKQSPIPDVVKSCYQTSKIIFSKVDERFHLQDKAWELSKNSIEKAIELDEQYAIHEVVTETMFATLTGLVKAGIAYKETPSYAAAKAAAAAGALEGAAPVPALDAISSGRSHNPQETNQSKKQTKSKQSKDLKQADAAAANSNRSGIMGGWGSRGKKTAIVESEPEYDSEVDSDEGEYDSEGSGRNSTTSSRSRSSAMSSSSSTGFSSDADQDSGEGEMDDDEDEVIELNQQTLRPTPKMASSTIQNDKAREKIDMFSALKGAASLVYNTL
ncbi:hypothetical protein BGX20_007931 [Mortierella sp. AD010]|nr:hypothetical protein BGX20_007931 [Mortierella sp. AD010]